LARPACGDGSTGRDRSDTPPAAAWILCGWVRSIADSPNGRQKKKRNEKWQTEHRTATTTYPCYLPILGEFSRSWSCQFAVAKIGYS